MPNPIGRRAFLTAMSATAVAGACRSRHRSRRDRAAPVAFDVGGPDRAARVRRQVPRAGGSGDRRRGARPSLSQRHARAGTRGRAAAPGGPGRLHGLGHGHLGQRRAEAAGLRLPVSLARLGSRARRRRRAGRARRGRLSRADGAHAAACLGRLVRLPPGGHAVARRHRGRPARRPEDPDHPVADLREGGRADGRQPDADGVRRGLHVAADRRHRRLRARCEHDAAAALLRGRPLHDAHAPHRRRARPLRVERRHGADSSGDPRR